jgi:hypothetical protein
MTFEDIVLCVYFAVAIVVGIGWLIFREKPSGSYMIPEEGIGFNAMFVGLMWPFGLVGIAALIIWAIASGESRWSR